jgi:branched-chain amino acid transport system permease protein
MLYIAIGDNKAWQGKITDMCVFMVLASMWNLLTGFSGLVSIGQQAYVGLGAYGLIVMANGVGINMYLAVVPAAIIVALLAIPIGVVAFRLRGGYFAIGTWVVAEVARLVVKNNQTTVIGAGTGTSLNVPESLRDGRYTTTTILAISVAVAAVVFVYFFLRSRFGLALQAVRDSESGARSLGVNAYSVRFVVYVVAAFFTALAAATYYIKGLNVQPDAAFSVGSWTAPIIVMVVIGGIGTIEGPIIGAVLYYLVRDYVSNQDFFSDPTFLIVTGVVAILFALFVKGGIWGLLSRRFPKLIIFPVQRRIHIDGVTFDQRGT